MEKPEPALGGISIEYSDANNIESDIVSILSKLKFIQWCELNIDEKSNLFSKFMTNLWKVHPFREGNTRTIITFCCYYAEIKGFPLDTDLLVERYISCRNL